MDARESRDRIDATQESRTLRPRSGYALVFVVWAIGLSVVVTLIAQGSFLVLLRYLPLVLLAAYCAWLLFWSPSVTISPAGVSIRNLLRVHDVTWPAIQLVDTRWALNLRTTRGRITAWSAPAPSRFTVLRTAPADVRGLPQSTYGPEGIRPGDIPSSHSGLAALYVRRYWEQLRDAGFLESTAVEGTGVTTRWLPIETGVLIVLAAVTAIVTVLF
jgi:hypothetical protein